jgi:hypothetical protein
MRDGVPEGRPGPALRRLERAGLLLLALGAVGEAGHLLLERFGANLAHHAFHILFGVVAFVAFGAFVVADLRRHGPPSFSWRIRRP